MSEELKYGELTQKMNFAEGRNYLRRHKLGVGLNSSIQLQSLPLESVVVRCELCVQKGHEGHEEGTKNARHFRTSFIENIRSLIGKLFQNPNNPRS